MTLPTPDVLAPGAGRSFVPGIQVKVDRGSSPGFTVFESTLQPYWPGPPAHRHGSDDEAFLVLAGSVAFTLDDELHRCPAGSFVFVPRGSVPAFANPEPEPARVLVITTPAVLGLIEAVYAEAAADPDTAAALYARFVSELVAPSTG